MARKITVRSIQALTAVCTIFLMVGFLSFFWAPATIAFRVITGRMRVCSYDQAYRAVQMSRAERDYIKGLAREARLLETQAGLEHWATAAGTLWLPHGSLTGVLQDIAEQARDIYGAGSEGVRPGDVVIDCGANIGLFTKKAIERGASLVVAVEPVPENLDCLKRNVQAEIAEKRVIVYPKGVWDREDLLTINIDPENSAADSFIIMRTGGRESRKLPLTTIDTLVRELGLSRIDFIKMDIEAAERKAIAGSRQTIFRQKPRMAISVYHLPDDPVVIPSEVRQLNSQYRVDCDCQDSDGRIGPQVMKFH